MRTGILLALLAVAVLLISGCGKTPPTEQTGPDSTALEDRAIEEADRGAQVDSTGAAPSECDPAPFANGAELKVSTYADLDGDGQDECLMGFQETETDELGEPTGPAFFELAKWNGEEWEEWFGIPAPDGETFVDERSVLFAEDINEDGTVELGIMFYGFGVSSRPENLYVWQVIGEGLEPAIDGECLQSSSDNGFAVEDINSDFPGREIAMAVAQMGDEAHADAHQYEVIIYAWNDGLYRLVTDALLDGKFNSPRDAIDAYEPPEGE